MKINVWHSIELGTVDASIGLKHAYVLITDKLDICGKLICVDKQKIANRNSIPHELCD